jgi:hypothetical protein
MSDPGRKITDGWNEEIEVFGHHVRTLNRRAHVADENSITEPHAL